MLTIDHKDNTNGHIQYSMGYPSTPITSYIQSPIQYQQPQPPQQPPQQQIQSPQYTTVYDNSTPQSNHAHPYDYNNSPMANNNNNNVLRVRRPPPTTNSTTPIYNNNLPPTSQFNQVQTPKNKAKSTTTTGGNPLYKFWLTLNLMCRSKAWLYSTDYWRKWNHANGSVDEKESESDTKQESEQEPEDPEPEEDKYGKNSPYRIIKRHKYKAIISLVLFMCLFAYFFHHHSSAIHFDPVKADLPIVQYYESKTRQNPIVNDYEKVFRSYWIQELKAREHLKNKDSLEEYLKKYPKSKCVSTLEIDDILQFPFHIAIKNTGFNKHDMPYIHMIYPIINEFENQTAIVEVEHEEIPSHCIRFGYNNQKLVKQKRIHNPITVLYRGLDKEIYYATLYGQYSVCVQHYIQIYNDKWPCKK